MEEVVAEADLADPNPDVRDLFNHYDGLYFQGALAAAGFIVQWSDSITSSSFGSCTFSRPKNTIRLSESVLKYRSCTDRKNALLHEMIHAIIYMKHHRKDRNHGPRFRAWMDAINSCCAEDHQRPDGGYKITARHDFSPEEPHSLKGNVWKCGACGDTLLRAINQGPPSYDNCIENVDINASCGNMLCHWHKHKNDCRGTYEKMMLISDAPSPKEVAGGAQLLLTLPSEMSKSKGTIQESSSSILQLQGSTKATKPNAEDKHLCPVSGSSGTPQGSSSLKKAGKRHRPEIVQETSVLPAVPRGKPNQKHGLAATVKQEPLSMEGYNDAKSPGRDTSKKAGKQHKPDDLQKTSVVLPSAPQGTTKLKQALVAIDNEKLSSAEHCSDAKSPKTNTSKKAGEQYELDIAEKACSQATYPQKRLKQDLVVPEKKERSPVTGCSNEKLLDRSSSKKAYRQHEPEDIRTNTVLPTAPGIKHMASIFVASKKQRKGKSKRKPVREKEYAVMSAWLDYYESDRSSSSTEPLINKRTERRRIERERARKIERERERAKIEIERAKIQTYSRQKKLTPAPLVNSRTNASVSSHIIKMETREDESMQQYRLPSRCSDDAVVTTANQVVVTPATGDLPQPSAPCLDIVPFLQPADTLTSPDQSTVPDIIYISDDD